MSAPISGTPSTVPASVLDYAKEAPAVERREVRHLRDLSSQQWKAGIAAWLGWLFDGLDMHLYTIVAPTVVAVLMHAGAADPQVPQKGALIQGAFLCCS